MSTNKLRRDRLHDEGMAAAMDGLPCEYKATGRHSELDRAAWENGWRQGHRTMERRRALDRWPGWAVD